MPEEEFVECLIFLREQWLGRNPLVRHWSCVAETHPSCDNEPGQYAQLGLWR